MKFTTFFKAALVAAFVAIGTVGCSNDDDVIDDEVDTPDPEVPVVVDLKLTVTVNAGSNTTETVVTVVPSVDDAPYYASIWTKDEVGSASNDALKAKILEAEDFNDALYTGTTELSEILPTGDYVVVTMGWDGTTNTSTPAKKAFSVAPPSLTLTLDEVGSTDIRFSVTSTDPDATYALGYISTSYYEDYTESELMKAFVEMMLDDYGDDLSEYLEKGDMEDTVDNLSPNTEYTIFAFYCNADGSEYYGLVSASGKTVYPDETPTSEYSKYLGTYVMNATGTFKDSNTGATSKEAIEYEIKVEQDVANYTYKVTGLTVSGSDLKSPAIWTFDKETKTMWITQNLNLGDYGDGRKFAFYGYASGAGKDVVFSNEVLPFAEVVLNGDDSCTINWRTVTATSGVSYTFYSWNYGLLDPETGYLYNFQSDPDEMENITLTKGAIEVDPKYEAYLGDWALTSDGSFYGDQTGMYASDENLTYNISIETYTKNKSLVVYGWENDEDLPLRLDYNGDGTVSLGEFYFGTTSSGIYVVSSAITEDDEYGIDVWLLNVLGASDDPVATGSINGNTLSFQGNHLSYTAEDGSVFNTDCVGYMFCGITFDTDGYLSNLYYYNTEWAKFPMSGSQSGTSAKASSKKNLSSMKFVKVPTMKLSSVANAANVYVKPSTLSKTRTFTSKDATATRSTLGVAEVSDAKFMTVK